MAALIPKTFACVSAREARRRDCPNAVVAIVSVVETVPLFGSESCDGLKLHVVSAGKPEHAKLVTVPVRPFKL